MTGGGSEIPSTKLHRRPGEGGLRPGSDASTLGGRGSSSKGGGPHMFVPAWGYGSVRAESSPPRCPRWGASGFLPGVWERSACYFRAICPPGSFVWRVPPRVRLTSGVLLLEVLVVIPSMIIEGKRRTLEPHRSAGRARPVRPAPARDGWAQRQGGGLASRLCRTFGTSLPALALAATYG